MTLTIDRTMLLIITIFTLTIYSSDGSAASDRKTANSENEWAVEIGKTQVYPDDDGFLGDTIVFFKNHNSYEYAPENPPHILIPPIERVNVGTEELFVSFWLYGQKNWLVRVFNPEKSQSTVVCEFLTEANESMPRPDLIRLNGTKLEVLRKSDIDSVGKWAPCSPKK